MTRHNFVSSLEGSISGFKSTFHGESLQLRLENRISPKATETGVIKGGIWLGLSCNLFITIVTILR